MVCLDYYVSSFPALAELVKNAELPFSSIAHNHPELIGTFRTAAIKSFEYAYELSIRLIRRRLKSMAATAAEIEQMEFKTLMRTAAEKGIIDNPLPWLLFSRKTKHHIPHLRRNQIARCSVRNPSIYRARQVLARSPQCAARCT